MYIYNITCRIPEFIEGFIFKDVIAPEEVHNLILRRDSPISTDSDTVEIQKLAQEKFGGKREVKGGWADYEWEPQVQIIGISFLGAG